MSGAQLLRFLAEVEKIAEDRTEPREIMAPAIHHMARLMTIVEEKGLMSHDEVISESTFLIDFAQDQTRDTVSRGQALQAMGIVGQQAGRPAIAAILTDPANLNIPDLARSACVALQRLGGEEAGAAIAGVLAKTSDASVFGTAAYCLGQIKTPSSMVALVGSTGRFPNSAAVGAALVDLDSVIEEVLSNPNNPNLVEAIQATTFLWQDGQKQQYIPALRALLATAPDQARSEALDRLIGEAASHDLTSEKQELSGLLSVVQAQPILARQVEQMQRRLFATLLTPNGSTEATPARVPTK